MNGLRLIMVHERAEVQYLNGNFYDGELKDGKRNGIGIYSCDNGDIFTGEWEDGERIRGTETFWCRETEGLSGEYYIGDYENDLFHGKGTFYISSMQIYENWEEGMPIKSFSIHGAGQAAPKFTSEVLPEVLFTDPDDVVIERMPYITHYYEGEWANGRPHGKGTFYWGYGGEHELDMNGVERWNGHLEGEWREGVYLNDYSVGETQSWILDKGETPLTHLYNGNMNPETVLLINSMFKEKTLLMRGYLSDE